MNRYHKKRLEAKKIARMAEKGESRPKSGNDDKWGPRRFAAALVTQAWKRNGKPDSKDGGGGGKKGCSLH